MFDNANDIRLVEDSINSISLTDKPYSGDQAGTNIIGQEHLASKPSSVGICVTG